MNKYFINEILKISYIKNSTVYNQLKRFKCLYKITYLDINNIFRYRNLLRIDIND